MKTYLEINKETEEHKYKRKQKHNQNREEISDHLMECISNYLFVSIREELRVAISTILGSSESSTGIFINLSRFNSLK